MKKKVLCLVLTLCVLAGLLCIPAAAEETEVTADNKFFCLLAADANGDGACTTDDAQMILNIVSKTEKAPEEKSFDVDGDGMVSLLDAVAALEYATGIRNYNSEMLDVVNAQLNSVKKDLPGFKYDNIVHCKSCKVTTAMDNLSLAERLLLASYMDKIVVTDKNLVDYFKGMESVVPEEEKASYQQQIKEAERLTEPQESTGTVYPGIRISHTNIFPLKGKEVSSTLAYSDIKTISAAADKENYTVTVTLDPKTYTSSSTYLTAVKNGTLSYAKAFNDLPTEYMIGDSQLKNLNIKNGTLSITVNTKTGLITAADYSYDYVIKLYKEENSDVNGKTVVFKMTTTQTVFVTDHFDITRPAEVA